MCFKASEVTDLAPQPHRLLPLPSTPIPLYPSTPHSLHHRTTQVDMGHHWLLQYHTMAELSRAMHAYGGSLKIVRIRRDRLATAFSYAQTKRGGPCGTRCFYCLWYVVPTCWYEVCVGSV